MGAVSPYCTRFIGLPYYTSQTNRELHNAPLGDNGEKYFGLVNSHNTCYMNSVLQSLYFCMPFRTSVIKHLNSERDGDSSSDSLLISLAELFAQIDSQKRSVGSITPSRFLSRLRKANEIFCTTEHQDAHEFLHFLLNDIAENLTKRVQKQQKGTKQIKHDDPDAPEEEPRTWVHNIFQGHLVNQMKCLCCESVTVRREPFLDLSVDIERHTSIAACLRAFESTELLRSGNKFFCDTCGCLQEAEKRLRICEFPSVLTLHLKRFKYVERLGRCCRLPYRVVFPLQLRVEPTGGQKKQNSDPGYDLNSQKSPAQNITGSPSQSRVFQLRSVIVHIGRESARGHYVTVVRINDVCVLMDDDIVREVEPEVLRSFYGSAASGNSSHSGSVSFPSVS